MRAGRTLLVLSIVTRAGVIAILCFLALLTSYHNLKRSYNHPRLVELSEGKAMRVFYEKTDAFFAQFGDPAEEAQKSGGMTWSIRLGGVPFTDPVAVLSVMARSHRWELGFGLGLIIPLTMSLLFGRVFCAYVCPASLLFFAISRLRQLLAKFFWLPEFSLNRGFCWGFSWEGSSRPSGSGMASGPSFSPILPSARRFSMALPTGRSRFLSGACSCFPCSISSWASSSPAGTSVRPGGFSARSAGNPSSPSSATPPTVSRRARVVSMFAR